MHLENQNESAKAAEVGKETADGMIAWVQELLEDGLYDEDACGEAKRMLSTARLLTQNAEARKKIESLLVDIESRYGSLG